MTKHTPGPWKIEEDKAGHLNICTGEEREVQEANARLIAAAPELLEAAKEAQCSCDAFMRDSGHKLGCWMPTLLEAIAKAEGQS